MEKYNIFVISDNQTFAKNFISKILLLRKTDQIGSCGYLDAKNELQNLSPDIVFFHIKDYMLLLNFLDKNFVQLSKVPS